MNVHSMNNKNNFTHHFIKKTDLHVLIFKTDIRNKKDLKAIEPVFNTDQSIIKWNVDKHDIDNILRIESMINNPAQIITAINQAGYYCEELND